jgi:hypothetical protein
MAGKLATILATKADLVEGKIPETQIPPTIAGTKITVSSTPPSNPQPNDLWIQTN